MRKPLLIAAGSLSVAIGALGVVVPGLPTTVFLIIAAACYVRSSDRLYAWLLDHKVFGKYIRRYQERKAMTRRSKVIALLSMWSMIGLSEGLLWGRTVVQVIVCALGLIGTVTIGWIVPTDTEPAETPVD